MDFKTPSEIAANYRPVAELDIPYITSWADMERDLSAWLGNKMQQKAIRSLYELEQAIYILNDENIIDEWRKLQTSDHFYYMCTKWFSDGDVHKYFNPHESPYECFISFMNIVEDLEIHLEREIEKLPEQTEEKTLLQKTLHKMRTQLS
jgi:alpha-amylase